MKASQVVTLVTSPGDSAGVKDVANVVVKYLSPYLKQGSNVSKVRTTY